MSKREAIVYGRRACLAVAEYRPYSILRVLYDNSTSTRDLAPLLQACARERQPYRSVTAEELVKISGSAHHEGVVVITHRPRASHLDQSLERTQARIENGAYMAHTWIALDGVQNDHNIGAIARSLAWFGGGGIIWEAKRPQLSGAALRIAQGGAEAIELIAVDRLSNALRYLKDQGFTLIGADQGSSVHALNHTLKDTLKSPTCWVVGSEQFGLSKRCRDLCDIRVAIPGSGQLESLNVSVSAGILIAQSYAALGRD